MSTAIPQKMKMFTTGNKSHRAYQGDLPINLLHSTKFRPGTRPFHAGTLHFGKSKNKLILRRIYEISMKIRMLTSWPF
jgi:hypothetical protein